MPHGDAVGEITPAQVVTVIFDSQLQSPLPVTHATYRTIRKNPTVALARALSTAPVVAAEWSVEADREVDPEVVDFVKNQFLPIRQPLLETSLNGGVDFGWQPWEKVFAVNGETGLVELKKLKPLLQDFTDILVDKNTGAFLGFQQEVEGRNIVIPAPQTLLISFRVEGTCWYGQSLLENIRGSFDEWTKANEGAARYDKKISGSHFIVKYPIGKSIYKGVETDNSVVADELLKSLKSSSAITIPQIVARHISEMDKAATGWDVSIISDSGGTQTFTPRLEYLDRMMVRGILVPERAILEGKFGTKADAKAHADLALTHMDLTHQHVTRLINWHAVDQLLALNFGESARGTVRLEAVPLADAKIALIRELYTALLTNPIGFVEEFGTLDTRAMKEALGLPVKDDESFLTDELEPRPVPPIGDNISQAVLDRLNGR